MTGVWLGDARATKRVAAWMTVAALVIGLMSVTGPAANATGSAENSAAPTSLAVDAVVKTADLSKFQPGNIISDAAFSNRGSMTEGQIQSFLEGKVPRCQSGYVCLKDWYDTSRTTTADAMCGAYSGGVRERASTIIYKVAQACGINPQVLLVMLQKEQGLVLHTWPSDWRYTIAMGQGCPDTAACDTRYYGFFNQVYGAAWQLKRYANPAGTSQYFTWYAPGKTWNVRWHPNAGCGSAPVYIQNQATANLYYYTPYQPNAAAIRAGYGEGDGCSSYGNRNFYQYFTDWFGVTQFSASGQIGDYWKSLGAGAGRLGEPIGAQMSSSVNGGGTYQNFQNAVVIVSGGVISHHFYNSLIYAHYIAYGAHNGALGWPRQTENCTLRAGQCFTVYSNGVLGWTASTGVHSLTGDRAAAYLKFGGPTSELGIPVGADQWVDAARGRGVINALSGGTMYTRDGTPTSILTAGSIIGGTYTASGGAAGDLGWPTMSEACDSGCRVQFQNGMLAWTQTDGVYRIDAGVFAIYAASGGLSGPYGVPLGPPRPLSGAATAGATQAFKGGIAYLPVSRPATMLAASDPIAVRYAEMGGPIGRLGWPITSSGCQADRCRVEFQNGILDYSNAGGVQEVSGASVAFVRESTGPATEIGIAVGAPVSLSVNGGGSKQPFSGGTVTQTTSGRAAFLTTPSLIRATWESAGAEGGVLGWPFASESCSPGSCFASFSSGLLGWTPASGVNSVNGKRYADYLAAGGQKSFGVPTGADETLQQGVRQNFSRAISYTLGDTTTWQMRDSLIHSGYLSSGGPTGPFGWPTTFEQCGGAMCFTLFQGGVIAWTPAAGVVTTSPSKAGALTAGASPTSSSRGTSGWTVPMTGGVAYLSAGAAVVELYADSLIHQAYRDSGGIKGQLGWPISPERCSASACTASFEGGRIDWSYSSGVVVTLR
jgi:uncharacterized protein with LGFP repeats